jgi:hypothetical protein
MQKVPLDTKVPLYVCPAVHVQDVVALKGLDGGVLQDAVAIKGLDGALGGVVLDGLT